MGKQHFDLLPLAARGAIGIRLSDVARHVPCSLEDAAGNFASWLLRAAAWLQGAAVAVIFAGPVDQRSAIVHQRAPATQHLAGRAEVDVALVVVGEVAAGEGVVGALRLVEDGDMRLDSALMN